MRTALLIDVEALLFDANGMRARCLSEALALEGVDCAPELVIQAHAGRTAYMALQQIPAAAALDTIGMELVLRRTADAMTDAIARGAPPFDPRVRDSLAALAGEFPLAAVTRAPIAEAQHLLELAGLDSAFVSVRSLAACETVEHHRVWSDARARLFADRAVGLAPAPLIPGIRDAGIIAVQVGDGPADIMCPHIDSLTRVNTSFIASLF